WRPTMSYPNGAVAMRTTTESPLTDRERQVVELIARGKSNTEIANELGVSFPTAKAHVSHILTKLGVDSREEAARWLDLHAAPVQPSIFARWVRAIVGLPLAANSGRLLAVAATGTAVVAIAVVTIAVFATRGDSEGATPIPPETVTAGEDYSLSGAECPVESAICDAATAFFPDIAARDVDALMANAAPRTVTCPAPGEPVPVILFGPSDLCDGAVEGDVREYYTVSSGGEGTAADEAQFRTALTAYLATLPTTTATAPDTFGRPEPSIGAIACFRASDNLGTCGDSWIEIVLTAVDADGERHVSCFEIHRPPTAETYALVSFGCGVPPISYVEGFQSSTATNIDGTPGTFRSYPW
ncbi:MAG TPA: response regulator transcription factor, partial [Tepidiformaceae bacterium]|nr:response regulator transcription factor [Tepidiformaceae bacterium]